MKRRTALTTLGLGLAGMSLAGHGLAAGSTPRKSGNTSDTTQAATGQPAPFDFDTRTVRLNDGNTMPIIGLGVYTLNNAQTEASVRNALKDGYRLVDTAHIYGNEAAVGQAVKASGIPRREVFITTKLWTNDFPDASAEIDRMLKRLNADHIDLLLLHHPAEHDGDAYQAMEKAVKAGKVKSIGLSNYYEKEFNDILRVATITPAVVQNETHPYNQWKELKPFLGRHGTILESWYPLGGRSRFSGKNTLLGNPTFVTLGRKYGKSPAQIILRWHLQDGNIVIPGTSNPAHIKENIDIFDFSLDKDEMARIAALDRKERFSNW